MTLNKKHCLTLLVIMLVLLLGAGLVSASDTNDTSQVIKDNNKLSAPSNYDVDKVVQSDLTTIKSDADVEKISNTSENTKTIKTNKQTANSEKTSDSNIIKNNINDDIEKTIKGDGEGTFTELQELINVNSVINLDKTYKFTPGIDDQEGLSMVNGIVINHDITINGDNYALDGSNLSRIFYIDESITVNINKVIFKNAKTTGNGSAIYTLSTINVDQCTFINNTGNASGAVWISDLASNTKIINSTFINNTAKGYNTTSNGRTYYYGDGGALYFNSGSINALIHNSTFINNSANANGGAILLNATYSNITSSRFYNNSAPYAAGAVRLEGKYLLVNDSLFDGNYDPQGNYSWGSAIYLTGDFTNITYSNFTNHHGANTGGAVAIDGSDDTLDTNIFINNTAYNGGAVYVEENENVIFDHNTFTNNTADLNGGAILISDHANNTKILNSNFTNNHAIGYNNSGWLYGDGGAVYFAVGCSDGLIENSTFTNNTALSKAGAINWNGDQGQIIACNFTNNNASLDGGAVLFTGNNGYINSSIFINNTSNYAGGALRISGNNSRVNNTLFDRNNDPKNKVWGSAIYISGHNTDIEYSNFTNNYGSVSAGAVYVAGVNTTVSYSIFNNNTASADAGAVLLNGTNGSILYSNFTNNAAGHEGGAVYINGSNGNISNSNFTSNTAITNAGAIYIKGQNVTLAESNFTHNNVISGNGGSLYVSGNNASISHADFSHNNASADGGAIYIQGTKTTFENCNMTYNRAKGNGGAIYNKGTNVTVNYSNFEFNHANGDGGSMDLSGSSNSVIKGCNFTNETCNTRGGSISAYSTTNLDLLDSIFINCSNGNFHGGTVYLEATSANSNLKVDNCTIINGVAGKDAGAIYFQNQNGKNSTLSNCTFLNCSSLTRSPGAVCWREDNGLIINNQFINCSAMSTDSTQYSGQGGAMYLENARNNMLINNTFVNCSASYDGAAIYYRANSKNNTHINCTFINNTAHRNGGALYFLNANNTYDGCVFINNTAINGGSIYYSVNDGLIIRNCVFENNTNITDGGFIYIAGNNAVINNTTFTNGLAENGGALYITKDITLNDCNITNNNATNGSGIYLKTGTVRLTNVRLLDNQAHSANVSANKHEFVEGGTKHITGVFLGCDNYLNGIYWAGGNIICVNVMYLGVNGVVNTDDVPATVHLNETYQNITLGVYDRNNQLKYNITTQTDEFGNYEFEFPYDPNDGFRLYHPEDDYYTYIVDTFNKLAANLTVNVTNITYGEEEIIVIRVNRTSEDDPLPTGALTVYLNSTLEGFVNQTFEIEEIGDGLVEISTPPLNLLNVTDYDVYVRYSGDGRYLSEITTANFTVSKAQSSLDFDVTNYTYNETGDISFDLKGIEDKPMAGIVLVNITGRETDGTIYTWNDIRLNIQVNGEEVTGNIIELPILNAGEYEVTAFYNESLNYTSSLTTHKFTVYKANPVINVTATDTGDEIFDISVHIKPEVATSAVRITIVNQTGAIFLDQSYTLDNSRTSQLLEVLPVGTYNVTVNYYGDKNHYEGNNKTQFVVTTENYPINIEVTDMIYTESQVMNITVPADSNLDNLVIKLNNQILTGYSISQDGLIQIDTSTLTDIINDGKLVVGEYALNVSYLADGHYRSNSSLKTFNVQKANPVIDVEVHNISYGQDENVAITTDSYNASGDVTVKLINSAGSIIDTKEYDLEYGEAIEFNYLELEPDTYTISISYENDENYNDLDVTKQFTVKTQIITINDLSDIYVGETQRIYGIITDGYGRAVTEGSVNITLSNGTNLTCTLDSNGMYSIEPTFAKNGTYILNASYILNDKVRTLSENRQFNVQRIPTTTTVRIVNNTIGHVAIDVIVQENVPGKYTGYVQEGVINITIPGINGGNPVQYPIAGVNTTISLDDIENVGTIPVTVVFNGTEKYVESTGLNISDPSEEFTHIDVEPIGSNMTIVINPNPVVSGSDVVINGRVYDDAGVEITEGTVNIKIGTDVFNDIPVTIDGYSKTYTTSIVGIIPVEVHFNGLNDSNNNLKVLESTNDTTFVVEVNKYKTNITINPLSGIEINKTFTITVNLTNRTGDAIKNKPLNILINKVPVTDVGVTDNNGQLIFEYEVHDNSILLIEAEFVEDEQYRGNSTYLLYTGPIPLLESNISVEVANTPVCVDDPVEITGSLNDSRKNAIKDAEVIIKINNTEVGRTTTDSNGQYTFTLTKDDENYRRYLQYNELPYTVTAVYIGTVNVLSGSAATTTYTVEKTPTEITFGNVEAKVNTEFTIEVKLTNATGDKEALSGKTVKVNITVNGQTTAYKISGQDPITDADGKVYVTYTPLDNSTITIDAAFDGDDVFSQSNQTSTIDVDLMKSTITVNVNPVSVVLTGEVTVTGTLLNVTAGDLAGEIVTVTVDGNDYTSTVDSEGNFKVEHVTTQNTGTITVTATYDGIENILEGDTDECTFEVTKIPTMVTIVDIDDVEVNKPFDIVITLTNTTDDKDPVSDRPVKVTINGQTITDITSTDENGQITISYTPTDNSPITITAEFEGDDQYRQSNVATLVIEDISLSVPVITVDVNETSLARGDSVNITGTLVDAMGNPIADADVVLVINDTLTISGIKTDADGQYSTVQSNLVPGTYTVKTLYEGLEDIYTESNTATTGYIVNDYAISISIDENVINIGESITIQGCVVDGRGVLVKEGTVIVTLDNGTKFTYTIDSTTGLYGQSEVYDIAGHYVANATYIINSNANVTSSNVEFDVNKIPTTTTLTVVNNTVGNVTIEVTVTNQTGLPVEMGNVTVEFGDGTPITLKNLTNGKINITIPSEDTTTLNVKVTYNQNDKYVDSSNSIEIPVAKMNATIMVDVDSTSLYVGESVTINVNVTDEYGNQITDIDDVEIYINNQPVDKSDISIVDGNFTVVKQADVNGTFTVNATYAGNSNVNPVNSTSVEYVVNKIPTIISITPISDVEVNKEFTIEVTLTNQTGSPIEAKDIVITVNGIELENVPATDDAGKTSVKFTPTDSTELLIKAVYDGSEDTLYESSQANLTVQPGIIDSILTVTVSKSALYAGENVNISGILLDEHGNNLSDQTVTIYVNGNRVTSVLTDANGKYSHVINHLTTGEYTVQVVYDGVINAINGDSDTTAYSVQKMPTTIDINLPEQLEVLEAFDIEVTLKNNTVNDNALEGKTIVITVNDVPIKQVPLTDYQGKVVVTNTPTNNSSLEIKAVFAGDDYYLANEITKIIPSANVSLSQSSINVSVNKSSLYAGENINITGRLVDGQDNILKDAVVKLYINDEFEAIVLTNTSGEYTYVINDLSKGEYTIKAVYDGITGVINGSSNTTSYVVDKMNTTVTLTVPETASVNVPFDIEVTLNNKTDNTNPIGGKTIIITVNDEEIAALTTGNDGKAVVSYTPADNTTLVIKAVFAEDDNYYGNESLKTIATENISLSQSTINVSVNKSSLYAGESVNITGRLVDGQDNIITGADVKIYINDTLTATVKTNLTGEYAYAISNLAKGQYNVHVVYDGVNGVINASSNTTQYTVDKMPTNVELVVPENAEVLKAFDIEVTLTNNTDNSNAIGGKVIVITVNDEEIAQATTDSDGRVVISYTPQDNSTLVIKAVFAEDDYYYGNNDTKSIAGENIALSQSTITVEVDETTLGLGDSVNITGKLVDAQGKPIADAQVTIIIYDSQNNPVKVIADVTTDTNGEFAVVESDLKSGNYTVNAGYAGRENAVLASNDTCTYEVIDYSISINVDRPEIYVDEYLTVYGSVYDGRGQLIEEGTVHVVINNATGIYGQEDCTISNGVYAVNAKYPVSGKYNVTATYTISDTQNVTSDVDFFKVNKIPTITNVSIINNTVGNVTIDVVVKENAVGEYEDVLTNGTINVQVAGGEVISYPITSSNTTIKLDDITTTDIVSVSVVYPGSYKYEESTAINSTTGEAFDQIKADAQQSMITVEVEHNPTVYTDDITITGVVYDGLGNVIESGSVLITVDDKEAQTINFRGGKYSYTYTTDRIDNDIPVHVEYTGAYDDENLIIASSTNETTFNVTKIPTIVTITPISDAEVNKPFTIEVTLTNSSNAPIAGKSLIITINDVAMTGIPATDSNGKTNITYTPRDNTPLVIKAVYLETSDDVYLGCMTETTVNVDMTPSILTVKVDKPALYVGENINITGKLLDGQGNKIIDQAVTLYVNGNRITSVLTDGNGEYSYVINHVSSGEYTVEAVYDGIANAIIGDSDTTYYSVHKMPTNTTISMPSQAEVFVAFDIEVKLTNNTANTNPIEGKRILITVNGEVINHVPLTDNEGKTVITYTPQNNSTIVVKAVFDEDDYYLESSDLKTITAENINISNSTITVKVNKSQLYVDESVEITGRLTDGLNRPIATADVKVYINDELKATVESNRNGEYSYVINNLNKGSYDVKVVYDGVDNVISPANNTTSYIVNKIPTITNVSVLNNTQGNVTIDVIVTQNVSGQYTDVVSAGCVEVTVNGQTKQYPVKGHNTTIVLDANVFINTTDEVTFNVKYVENDKYLSSNGLNSTTGEEITVFIADSQQSTITVEVTPESQTTGQNVTIAGHVYDGMGNEITEGYVHISINDNSPLEVELHDDGYSYEYTTDIVGVNNVTVEFNDVMTDKGNVLIKSSANNTTFMVDKIKTITTVEILNNTVGNVTIDIKVVGTDENTTLTGDVNINVAGKNITVSLTGEDENLTVVLSSITAAGDIPVTVEYLGNSYYDTSIANNTADNKELTNITVVKQTANLTLATNVSNCYIGENVNISGNLTDGMGERIDGAVLTVNVGGKDYIVKTNSTGGYTLDYQTDNLGEITVTATFIDENFNDATNETTIEVTKIPTTTTAEVLNNTLSNVTVEVSVVDVYGDAVSGTVKVRNAYDYAQVLTEAQVVDGKVNITIPSEYIGALDVIIEYQENDTYLASNATNSSLGEDDPYKNITRIDVARIPTITSVEILNTTLSNVTIKVTVTNQTDEKVAKGTVSILDDEGNPITDLSEIVLDDGEAVIKLPFDEAKEYKFIIHYNENDVYMPSNATNTSAASQETENITVIDVTKIPTKTSVEVLNNTLGNVTIAITVTNMTDEAVTEGKVVIKDLNGNILKDDITLSQETATIQVPVDEAGKLMIVVEYQENDLYLPSNATNESASKPLDEVVGIDVTKIPTITNVEVISNLINNVTIGVNVTNATGVLVTKGQVVVYDIDGNELAQSQLTGGKANIIIPRNVDGILEVVVKYIENDIYYNSTAMNETAEVGRENITVINVTKIATKTSVEVLNNTIGNVTVHITTTNMTDEAVTTGHVVVRDQNNNIIGEGNLVNGGIDLTLNVTTPTKIGVNVTYNENDVYLSSNARNESLPSGATDENITYIDVAKQNATITINTNKDTVVIGEDVTIYGTLTDGMGKAIASGFVNVTINGTIHQAEVKDGLYTITNVTIAAGDYTVNATYLGNENISGITSENLYFTVNKIPTKTSVIILNNTAGNVTIEVTVTNATGELVNTGEVVVNDTSGTIITGSITDGKAILVIPTENTDTLYVNVSYTENTHYYPSNASNSSSTTPEYENVTIIDLVKQNASITIEVVNPSVIIGEVVTIRGQVFDGMGNIVTSGEVDVVVDGITIPTTIVDGYYTINNATYTAGVYDVNATYRGNATVDNVTSNTVNFTVNKMPTTTVVEVLNNTAGNVTIDVVITNATGESVTVGMFNVTVAGKTITVPVSGSNTTVKLDITEADDVAVSVTYLENENYTSSDAIDKATIPVGGSPEDGEVLDNITVVLQNATITVDATPNDAIVYQDVTISGTLTDGMAQPIANAFVELTVNDTTIITKTDADGKYSTTYTPLYNGTINVKAVYAGDATVNATENSTSFNVDKISTITNVEVTNTTLSNVTIRVNVTNSTEDPVNKGIITVYDTNSNQLATANLTGGIADIIIPIDTIGPLEVVVKYIENDLYLNSTALNDTAEAGRENITVIDVTRIPTITTVEILDDVAGNVTLSVNVTNMTKDAVDTGVVYVHNASNYDEILATGNIVGGNAVIKLDTILESGLIEVVVEYQENDIYFASNATNQTAEAGHENITVIDVQKQSVTITIELTDSSIIISENTTITGQVFDGMGEVVKAGNVTVYVTGEDGTVSEKTVQITDDKYSLTYTGLIAGNYTVKAKYLGNSSMTPAMSEELTFTVNKIPTKTSVEILNTTLSNVTIGVNVTNLTDDLVTKGNVTVKDTNGRVLANGTLNGGLVNITIPVDTIGQLRVIVTYNENNIYASSNATNKSAVGTPDEEIIVINVTRIPTVTTVEILNTSINNVTLGINVTNMTGTGVTIGSVVVTDTSGRILANGELVDSHITLQIPATQAGAMDVIVTYLENDLYLASNATNKSATTPSRENITVIDVTKLPTITSVEILNTTLGNVSIGVNVTNMTESLVDKGSIVVYDVDGNVLVSDTPLVNGRANISIPATIGGELEIIVEYQENDYYLASNATNKSATDPERENITVINVTKMPTVTMVDILNHTAGNVTVSVLVTNMTNDSVTEGTVVIKDSTTGEVIVNATLSDGKANIIIPVSNTDTLKVIVEYQENNYYYASNATNSTAAPADENITVIDVVKQKATISIEVNNNSIVISDSVVISGVVYDELGNIITEGQVLVDINGTTKVVDLTDSGYTLEYTPSMIADYKVNATYLGNDTVENATSKTTGFTVGKIPTKTNVTIINTTVGNVTIGVNVTNITDENVIKGNVTVYDMNGNELASEKLDEGLANITIPVEHDGQLSVVVTYDENDLYLASNATNSSASGTPSEEIIVVDVQKQDADITIELDKDEATIGEVVTITGTVSDGMGNPVLDGTVMIDIDGQKHTVNITDGKYSYDYVTNKAGKLPITATYNGKDGVINPATSESRELTVNKKQTKISTVQSGNTPGNTSLEVTVTDEDGNPVDEGNVTVTLPDGTNVTAPVKGGKAIVPINTTPGKMDVNITYNPTGTYDKATENTTLTTVKLNTTIPIDKINDVTIGDNITIHGSLSDQNGVDITNARIVVTINGKKYNTTTNKAGEYSLTYTTVTSGINNITVEYAGNTIYNPANNKTNFTVNKKDVELEVKQLSDKAGNTSIEVKVADDEGRPVKEGNVIVTLPDGTNITAPVVNGTAVVPLNTTPGSIKVNITYNGTDKYNKQSITSTVKTVKINTTIPINTIKTVSVGDKVNITGKLLDSNNKTIANANISIKVNNKSYNTTTNSKGEYKLTYTTVTSGINNVTVNYAGNKTYNAANNQTKFTVKINSTVKSKQTGSNVGNTTIQVNITDKNGNKVPNGTVTVKDKDGKVIGTGVVKNGTVSVKLDVPAGKQNITVTYNGNELINPSSMTQTISVNKNKAKLIINPIKNITFTQNAQITGKLTDIDGNPIANAKVVLNMDGVTKTVTTDRYGDYTLEYNTTNVGLNNVTAQFNGDDTYNSAKANSTYNASKIITYVKVDDIKGVLGDNITLRATVTDEFGTKVTGGQFVFKVNGLTLRENGKFASEGKPMILSPVNGTVTVTIVADTYLRSAVNITGAYGGNSKYYSSRSIVAGRASLVKRDAQIKVTTVKTTKQDVNITLKAVVTDVTGGKNNGPVKDYEDNFVVFKVNGITIKNDDGTAKQAKVVNGVATMDYYVPAGLAGKYTNLSDKYYTVMAVFGSGSYNPGVQNTTQFGVERSPISFVNNSVTLNSKTNEMAIKSKIVDYHNNLLKGTNTLCIKINGQTYKINNKTVFFDATDGNVDLNIILPYNVNKINSVEFVTGERVGYLGGRYTTTDINRI